MNRCDADDAAVIAALRLPLLEGAAWSFPGLATASGLSVYRVGQAVKRLRLVGKIDFKDLVLSPSMQVGLPPVSPASIDSASPAGVIQSPPEPVPAGDDLKTQVQAEADAEGLNRQRARSTGTVVRGAALIEPRRFGDTLPAPNEAIKHCKTEMPALWARCVAIAPDLGVMPGEAMLRAIGAGLDCLEEADG